ncbi:glycerol-3-phosphate dehydrogenase/oxidase [Marinobacterium litorale]|uniref:glycerol-3-phosphate dehydrogenase/oxidase n=1 Tax=Marinobacterium litorale TaxID=404770 RepID=UPI000402C2E3|nr:FAD-dependent oxidoreductase [Marinobacterium litorale]
MTLRARHLARLESETFDVAILGGGINGAVSAAALSAAGARVALIDRGDFAGETSSNSSNLAWGGIKYLESGELFLVDKLCRSRNRLMDAYPSSVREIRFLASIPKSFRKPPFAVHVGAWLYWLLGRGHTQRPERLSLRDLQDREPILDLTNVQAGIEYSDCYLLDNDARFTFNFIRRAMDQGCVAVNYMAAHTIQRAPDGNWQLTAENQQNGARIRLTSRSVINATGPWVDQLNRQAGRQTRNRHLFSKGIHLIVDRLTPNPRILTFFADDGRLFFVIPMGPKTCIGTTDTPVEHPEVAVTDTDREFVLSNINARLNLKRPLTVDDIIAERCGVRPLASGNSHDKQPEWTRLSRKHCIETDPDAPWLSIFGGKLTDCLNVGEEVCDAIEALGITLRRRGTRWYGEGEISQRRAFMEQARVMALDERTPPSSSEPLSSRLWRRYGYRAFEVLEGIRTHPDWGELLIENSEYLRGELMLAAEHEMITRLDDFLRRRSKIAQVVSRTALQADPGLQEACRILFGDNAEQKFCEYFQSDAAR